MLFFIAIFGSFASKSDLIKRHHRRHSYECYDDGREVQLGKSSKGLKKRKGACPYCTIFLVGKPNSPTCTNVGRLAARKRASSGL